MSHEPFLTAMRLKMYQDNIPAKDRLSTRVCDLVREYHLRWDKIIKVGNKYWTWPSKFLVTLFDMRVPDWCLITVTYIRSGVIFYVYDNDPYGIERHMDYESNEARMLHPAMINLDELGFAFLRGHQFDTLHGKIRII